MAYVTGYATSFEDLRTALINGCSANGWSTDGTRIWRGGCAVNVIVGSTYIGLQCGTGVSGGNVLNPCPITAYLGGELNFPVLYDLHVFDDEVYFIVNYKNNYYQQLSFGESRIAGTGAWVTGAHSRADRLSDALAISASLYGIELIYSHHVLGLFLYAPYGVNYGWSPSCSAIYIDGITSGWYGYEFGASAARLSNGGASSIIAPLLNCVPSRFNGTTVLLPIKAVLDVGAGGRAVVINLSHARFCRLDNVSPGDIIQYGNDKWKLYPWLRKNDLERNGSFDSVDHSGTFGYAIRYTGP